MISISQIIKELLAEKTRLILTILAVAWATASISSMLAIGEGLRLTFSEAVASVGSGILYVKGGTTATNYHGQPINQLVLLTPVDYELIKKIPLVKTISPEYNLSGNFQYASQKFNGQVQAVNPSYGAMRKIIPQPGGRFINDLDMQNMQRVIVLGDEVAKVLFKPTENPVGKTVFLDNQPFLVIGVMAKKLQMVSYADAYSSWIPATTYVRLNGLQQIENIVLVPTTIKDTALLKQQIRTVIAYQQHLDPNDPSIISYRDFNDLQTNTNLIFTGMEIFLGVVGALTLIVAGVGIANVMFISVNRATNEIGIRMAVGARSHQILIHYVLEALFATAIGGGLGLAMAEAVVFLIKSIPIHGKFFEFIGKPEPVLSTFIMAIVIVILGLIGLIAGIFPARKAASVDPAVALRHS